MTRLEQEVVDKALRWYRATQRTLGPAAPAATHARAEAAEDALERACERLALEKARAPS